MYHLIREEEHASGCKFQTYIYQEANGRLCKVHCFLLSDGKLEWYEVSPLTETKFSMGSDIDCDVIEALRTSQTLVRQPK